MKFAVLISGYGSNMEAIIKHCQKKKATCTKEKPWHLHPALVISNNENAVGLTTAKNLGIETQHIPSGKFRTRLDEESMQKYITTLQKNNIELVLLAGFMCVIHASLLNAYSGRIINVHPSLLPHYTGLNTTERALENKQPHIGVTIHLVNNEVDGGRILLQQSVPVLKFATPKDKQKHSDTSAPTSLKNRMQALEHALYQDLLERLNDRRITL